MHSSRAVFSSLHTQQGWFWVSLVEFARIGNRRVGGLDMGREGEKEGERMVPLLRRRLGREV